MKRSPNTLNPKLREVFVAAVGEWQARLGLGDWRIAVSDTPAKRNAAEVFKVDYEARLATIRLGTDLGGTPVTEDALSALALHELCHVLLRELIVLARDPNTADDVLNSAEHRVVNTLQRLLAPSRL